MNTPKMNDMSLLCKHIYYIWSYTLRRRGHALIGAVSVNECAWEQKKPPVWAAF